MIIANQRDHALHLWYQRFFWNYNSLRRLAPYVNYRRWAVYRLIDDNAQDPPPETAAVFLGSEPDPETITGKVLRALPATPPELAMIFKTTVKTMHGYLHNLKANGFALPTDATVENRTDGRGPKESRLWVRVKRT